MKHVLVICITLPAFLFSCSKDDTQEEICRESEVINYEPSTFFTVPNEVGTYWVYDYYRVNDLGESTPIWSRDTVTIIGDTIVNGEVYKQYENLHMISSDVLLRRLTNGTVYNEQGIQVYSTTEYNQEYNIDIIEVPQGEYLNRHSIMIDKRDEIVSVPYGDFNCIDREVRHFYDGYPVLSVCGDIVLKSHLYWADGVGEVKQVIAFMPSYFETCEIIERRLVDFYEP